MEDTNVFLGIKNYINHNDEYLIIEDNLIESYEELEKIYSYYYGRQYLEELKQQEQIICVQERTNTEEVSFAGEPYYKQEESNTYQVITSDLHGDISAFLNILLQNKMINLKGSYELIDLETLNGYSSFRSFQSVVMDSNYNVFYDSRCVILPKFELNKNVNVTFNYLGDLIDEGKFSTECFCMMLLLMKKAKNCDNFKINYIAGNHEIANIILEYEKVKGLFLRQHTKYYCCDNNKSEYLPRGRDCYKNISYNSHNFQMGCIAKHSVTLVKDGQMKLSYVDGNNIFIHANPSIESILCFLHMDKMKAIDGLKNAIEDYINDVTTKMNIDEQFDYYLRMVNDINKVFSKAVVKHQLDSSNLDSIFFLYISESHDLIKGGECPKGKVSLNFFSGLKYFVGHDSIAEWEYKFNGSKLYCLDGHGNGSHRFAKIAGVIIYTGSINSNEFQTRYNDVQRQINDVLKNEIIKKNELQKVQEKQKVDVLDKKVVEKGTGIVVEREELLRIENANDEVVCKCTQKLNKKSKCFGM